MPGAAVHPGPSAARETIVMALRRRLGEVATVVAVPVKDEDGHIAECLRALALQDEVRPDAIVLLVNNTTDRTVAIAQALRPSLPVPIEILEHWFPLEAASAGAARRMAMERAAVLLEAQPGPAALFTTDADGRVRPDWVAANLFHLRAGADAVAGRAVLDPADAAAIPDRLVADDAAECAYALALDRLDALLDPEPWDPLPRHVEHSGASIAVDLPTYRRAGGMPGAALAEDRRFFAALRRLDARIRHAPEIEVTVSGRMVGRAPGGMADTIHRRMAAADPYLDDALEPASAHASRADLRGRFRRAWQAGGASRQVLLPELARDLGLPTATLIAACASPAAGLGWETLEAASPALSRCLVPARDVHSELAAARRLLAELQSSSLVSHTRIEAE
ncbi:MAG: glycosyltransferase family 2 protein [Acetobacteraceae bacterium]